MSVHGKRELVTRLDRVPDSQFKWRDGQGKHWPLHEMETRHLFHVIRMIWDHSVPKEFQTTFKQRYSFPPFYTEEYMARMVRIGLPILIHRPDLEEYQAFWLDFMANALLTRKHRLKFFLMIDYKPRTQDNGGTY